MGKLQNGDEVMIVTMMMMEVVMWEERRERETERRRKREINMENRENNEKRERDGERETPNTNALAQTTLKITIGCVPRSPRRRFQGACRFSTHKKTAQRLDSSFRVSRRDERDQKKSSCTGACPSQAVLEMAASGAHARQASVNEPSGARLFSGFWVES